MAFKDQFQMMIVALDLALRISSTLDLSFVQVKCECKLGKVRCVYSLIWNHYKYYC